MNLERFISTLAKLILGAVALGGMLALGTQTATAQAMIVTTPFPFSAGSQSYPAGTYQFTLLSEWSLSIRNVNGGGESFFMVRPEENRALGSQAGLAFRNSEGHQNLQKIHLPGTMTAAELIPHDALSHRAKSNITSAISSEKLTGTKQNAMGR